MTRSYDNEAGGKRTSQTFRLGSLKDDKSMLMQEDMLSRKTNEEKNILENELKEIL